MVCTSRDPTRLSIRQTFANLTHQARKFPMISRRSASRFCMGATRAYSRRPEITLQMILNKQLPYFFKNLPGLAINVLNGSSYDVLSSAYSLPNGAQIAKWSAIQREFTVNRASEEIAAATSYPCSISPCTGHFYLIRVPPGSWEHIRSIRNAQWRIS